MSVQPQTQARFAFGENWQRFLGRYSPARLEAAQCSIIHLLGRERLDGLRFLDAGSGSGLFSAAAFALGASVVSFDYDAKSVAATASLRPADAGDRWVVMQGSLLDEAFMRGLGRFDVVYCWGVAHHTGDMYRALDMLAACAAHQLVVSIYNDQGKPSRRWLWVKRTYHERPALRPLLISGAWLRLWGVKFLQDLARGRPLHSWNTCAGDTRGMSARHDLIDWVGGYPFEVARPEQIFEFFSGRGFRMTTMRTTCGIGCNEFVFVRE